MQLRFALSDLFFIVVVVALLVCLFQSPAYDPPHYDDLLLRYQTPVVPNSFQDKGRLNPVIDLDAGGIRRYSDGNELFLQSHFHGWTCVTYPFVNKRGLLGIRPSMEYQPSRICQRIAWTVKHLSYAQYQGRKQAMRAINRLIDDYGEYPVA